MARGNAYVVGRLAEKVKIKKYGPSGFFDRVEPPCSEANRRLDQRGELWLRLLHEPAPTAKEIDGASETIEARVLHDWEIG
jgi:hypothetical protein